MTDRARLRRLSGLAVAAALAAAIWLGWDNYDRLLRIGALGPWRDWLVTFKAPLVGLAAVALLSVAQAVWSRFDRGG